MGIAIPQLAPASLDRTSGAQVIDGSLKFDSDAKTYITRTPGSAGNRKKFTYSCWLKRFEFGAEERFLGIAIDGNNQAAIKIQTNNQIQFFDYDNGSYVYNLQTTQVFRDTGWYHIVYAVDTTQAISSDRVKIYVNGKQVTDFSTETYPSQNVNARITNSQATEIGRYGPSDAQHLGARMSQVYLIDGLRLGPGFFGFFDPLTNTWRPKRLKDGDATANDGTTWSSVVTATGSGAVSGISGSYPVTNAFDGDASTYLETNGANISSNPAILTVTFPAGRQPSFSSDVVVYVGGSTTDTIKISFNGSPFKTVAMSATGFIPHTFASGTGTISEIKVSRQKANTNDGGASISRIIVDGVELQDSTTTTVDFGTTGFYLPMDGNSPIGQDKSGKGNDFTPVNFGGSMELDNPNVSGARPILNTTQGGAQAGVGVFGSKQNVGYAVTVYNDGGGNKYYIDGVKQDTVTGLIRGATYTFDTSDSTVSSHPFRFSATSNGSHGGGSEYTNGVAAITGAATTITVPHDAPNTLYYYCTSHSGMGADITGITTNEKLADQYASHCVLALPLVGANSDVSTSIACTSSTKSVTSNGDAAASSTQNNFYNGSFYFDGTDDRLTTDIGSGGLPNDFTIEYWIYADSISSDRGHFQMSATSGGLVQSTSSLMVSWGQSEGDTNMYVGNGSVTDIDDPNVNGVWKHYAVVRNSGTLKLYVNGKQAYSASNSVDMTGYRYLSISGYYNTNFLWLGYIQDFRIYKGVAKYTSDFVVPSTSPDILPDTPSGVSGGSKLTKITDGAVNFQADLDHLNVGDSSDYAFGTGDFTIEAFYYSRGSTAQQTIFGDVFGNSSGIYFRKREPSNGNVLGVYTNADIVLGATAVSDNTWHHVALTREGSNIRLFLDGKLDGSATDSTNLTSTEYFIGDTETTSSGEMNGFISNLRVIKGTALYTSSFTPPTAPLTNVTNTVLLCCQSPTSATTATVAPGSITANGNAAATNFNPFNTDINTVRGQETGYCTLNPLWKNSNSSNSGGTFTDGNLNHTTAGSNGNTPTCANIYASSGKFYWEVTLTSGSAFGIGVASDIFSSADYPGYGTGAANGQVSWGYNQNGVKIHNATSTSSYGSSYTVGDTIGVAMNLDTGELEYYKNGVSQGVAFTDLEGNLTACHADTGSAAGFSYNFGQKPFKFAPPDGFQPLNTANTRPVKVVARPDQYVGVATYTGTGSAFDINYNFSPDFAWVKGSSYNGNHQLCDSVRNGQAGGNRRFELPGTANQDGGGPGFINSGLNINTNAAINTNNEDYVAWCWKAGGAPTADNTQTSGAMTANSVSVDGALQSAYTPSGSPSTYPKRMSVGTDQGFSIVLFEGNASNRTLPHGLGKPAKFMIVKNMDTDSTGWAVYHDAIGTATNNYIELQATTAAGADDTAFQDTAPTSDVFSIGTKAAVNNDTDDTIAYIWADVPGMQKFGQFTGNSSADGVFVELGFKPAILLIKNDNSTGDWIIWDNERNKINPVDRQLWPYTNTGTYGAYDQVASSYPLDFLSNGFKIRTTDADMNSSSRTYIYAAWAEAPSVDLFGGGANAR